MTDSFLQSVTEALRSSGATTDDCPTLFFRVSAGVARRQRRRAITTAALVVVVGAAVAVPIAGLGGSGTSGSAVSAESPSPSAAVLTQCAVVLTQPANSYMRRAEAVYDGSYAVSATGCGQLAQPAPLAVVTHASRHWGTLAS